MLLAVVVLLGGRHQVPSQGLCARLVLFAAVKRISDGGPVQLHEGSIQFQQCAHVRMNLFPELQALPVDSAVGPERYRRCQEHKKDHQRESNRKLRMDLHVPVPFTCTDGIQLLAHE